MNSIALMGRLTHTPDLRTARDSGKEYARFSIAVKNSRDKENPDFFECYAFGKTGKFITDYFERGQMIAVTGQMHIAKKKDEETGKTMTYPSVTVLTADFCGDGKAKATDTQYTPKPAQSAAQTTTDAPDEFDSSLDDELPF